MNIDQEPLGRGILNSEVSIIRGLRRRVAIIECSRFILLHSNITLDQRSQAPCEVLRHGSRTRARNQQPQRKRSQSDPEKFPVSA